MISDSKHDATLTQGPGQTESCAVGSLAFPKDAVAGSSGVLLPGVRLRLRNDDGQLVGSREEMGEIEISSPSVLYEYIDQASEALVKPVTEEFWRPTGDVGLIRQCPSGEEHLFIVDRIRDMIKVKVSCRPVKRRASRAKFVLIVRLVGQPSRAW